MRIELAACAAASALVLSVPALGNLIQNGNFEGGNTGFTSSFTYMPVSQSPNINQYGVVSNSWQWTNFWDTVQGDHTTGQGLFMIADVGSTNTIWQQTVAVNAGTDYTLSAWLATWTTFPAATLAVEINGQVVSVWNAPGAVGPWVQSSANWNSGGATSATIRFYATQVFQPGDDVAIDDIVFIPGVGAFPVLMAGAAAFGRGRRRAA
jgi:hypothetical protein